MVKEKKYLKPTFWSLSGWRRDWAKREGLYLTGRNRNNAHHIGQGIKVINIKIVSALEAKGAHKYRLKALFRLRNSLIRALEYEVLNNIDVYSAPLPFYERGPSATIDGWVDERIPRDFPVDSREQLRALYEPHIGCDRSD